jgi:hypothetical protein
MIFPRQCQADTLMPSKPSHKLFGISVTQYYEAKRVTESVTEWMNLLQSAIVRFFVKMLIFRTIKTKKAHISALLVIPLELLPAVFIFSDFYPSLPLDADFQHFATF